MPRPSFTTHQWPVEPGADVTLRYAHTRLAQYAGNVYTRHCIVEVWSYQYSSESYYRLIHEGRDYIRVEQRARTAKGLAAVAHRFAREIIALSEGA